MGDVELDPTNPFNMNTNAICPTNDKQELEPTNPLNIESKSTNPFWDDSTSAEGSPRITNANLEESTKCFNEGAILKLSHVRKFLFSKLSI